jgi:hypothetical protein
MGLLLELEEDFVGLLLPLLPPFLADDMTLLLYLP